MCNFLSLLRLHLAIGQFIVGTKKADAALTTPAKNANYEKTLLISLR